MPPAAAESDAAEPTALSKSMRLRGGRPGRDADASDEGEEGEVGAGGEDSEIACPDLS